MILLSGESSSIAHYLLPMLREYDQVCSFDSRKGDLRDTRFITELIDCVAPHVFINLEQVDRYDEAEAFREWAYGVNGIAPGQVGHFCKEHDIFLIHISSASVYRSEEGLSAEDSPLEPLSVYADSKLLGEQNIVNSGCRHAIIRLPFVYGKNDLYLSSYLDQVKRRSPISVIEGQRVMPVYAADVAKLILFLVTRQIEGVYNFSGREEVSTYDFIFQAFEILKERDNLQYDPDIAEVAYDRFLSPVDYPFTMLLNNSRIDEQYTLDRTPLGAGLRKLIMEEKFV